MVWRYRDKLSAKPFAEKQEFHPMPGGRPRTSPSKSELHTFAEHLSTVRRSTGLTVADVLRRTGIADKAGYEIFRAQRLPTKTQADALARVLGSSVVESWRVAKAAVERAELAQRDTVNLRSWDDLPNPDPALTKILRAQLAVADRFPYELLGVDAPKVSSLYIPERLRWENPTSADTTLTTISAALAKHRNILITAEPGGGKSMAARRVVCRIAARWLRDNGTDVPLPEPVAAIYLPAIDIAPGRPWAESVADALVRSGRFHARPAAELFAERAQGTRWLIVVDGLDEIADRETRRAVLELLGDLMRGGGPYRFVLVSRPLPEDELRLLDRALPRFALQRFDADRLCQFSDRWFANKEVPEGTAERFVTAVSEADLGEVVAVPLFATIAAAVAGTGSPEDLPRSRLDLYERFVGELLEARSPSDILSPYPRWLRSQRVPLLEHLAQSHLANGVVHLVAAEHWVDRMCPAGLTSPRNAAAEIRHSLIETGVVTVDDTVVRFPHKSIAEYLAARARATRIPAYFPDLKSFLERNSHGGRRNLMMLTIAAWTRQPGNDPALAFRHLLGSPNLLPEAVDLIKTGVTPGPEIEKALITRILINCRDEDFSDKAAHELLVQLGPRRVSRHLFTEILLNASRKPRKLALAAKTYAAMFDRDEAASILTNISQTADTSALSDIAAHFDAIGMSSSSIDLYR
ncbi:hypothetical protein GCM10022247_36070 [Allokutzneria multivorans]|uniref:NACHT domain-containing protein n=1 Tax=Allokutzneria multivorans TaxID=1142134 RepID=A0ABP7SEC0_9PSEU